MENVKVSSKFAEKCHYREMVWVFSCGFLLSYSKKTSIFKLVILLVGQKYSNWTHIRQIRIH